jgi:hypothetical protein
MNKREWMLQFVLANPMFDMEDTVGAAARLYDAIIAATPETAQDGAWVEHDGDVSKAPEEGRMVEAIDENGDRYYEMSDALAWDWLQGSGNIVRWRYA